jgi:hypothetical protein
VGAGGDRCVVCPWHQSQFRLRDRLLRPHPNARVTEGVVHLLVVTDGTCPAAELRPVLALLTPPTRVTVLAVAEPPHGLGPPRSALDPAPTPLPPTVTEQLTAAAVEDGRLACEELRELFAPDVEIEIVSECGNLAKLACTQAATGGAQLVVFAGWRGQQRLRNAAVNAALQQDPSCPILLTP